MDVLHPWNCNYNLKVVWFHLAAISHPASRSRWQVPLQVSLSKTEDTLTGLFDLTFGGDNIWDELSLSRAHFFDVAFDQILRGAGNKFLNRWNLGLSLDSLRLRRLRWSLYTLTLGSHQWLLGWAGNFRFHGSLLRRSVGWLSYSFSWFLNRHDCMYHALWLDLIDIVMFLILTFWK